MSRTASKERVKSNITIDFAESDPSIDTLPATTRQLIGLTDSRTADTSRHINCNLRPHLRYPVSTSSSFYPTTSPSYPPPLRYCPFFSPPLAFPSHQRARSRELCPDSPSRDTIYEVDRPDPATIPRRSPRHRDCVAYQRRAKVGKGARLIGGTSVGARSPTVDVRRHHRRSFLPERPAHVRAPLSIRCASSRLKRTLTKLPSTTTLHAVR